MYSRKDPYEGEDFKSVLLGVMKWNKRPVVPANCPQEMQTLINQCMLDDPSKRPTFEEIDERLKQMEVPNVEPNDFRLSKLQMKQKELTESLLHDVFPKHIADILREGKKVEPETRDLVTIFFSDIVGFTKIAASLPPIKISQMLDRLYAEFDDLSHQHDIFKVETIGNFQICSLIYKCFCFLINQLYF